LTEKLIPVIFILIAVLKINFKNNKYLFFRKVMATYDMQTVKYFSKCEEVEI
jgi:hypothetical protein